MAKSNGSMTEAPQEVDVSQLPPELLEALGIAGGPQTMLVGADDDVQYHSGKAIIVPEGMSMEKLAKVAKRKAEELNEVHSFQHITQYRPDDGAAAAARVIKATFGLTVGKAQVSFFGSRPPEYKTINIAHNKRMEVPWGDLEVPALPGATFTFTGTSGANGPVFAVIVESPKKHKLVIEKFFNDLDNELRLNSIYRGKALWGAYELTFMNTTTFKASEIVFADQVQNTLDAAVFSLIEHTEATVAAGLPTKRAVLAYGPYGTGKSSLGLITAQRATRAGWTFLSAKAGKDKLKPVLETAALYGPAVVFVEDIDAHTPKAKDTDAISELLDLFDGIGSKDSKLLVVMTTNNIDRIPAGMLRPGRLDYCVEINGLDRGGVERLVKAVVRKDLLDSKVDYDEVYSHMADWQPAWVRAVCDRAQSFAIARAVKSGETELSYSLTTEDLVGAALSLEPQLKLMREALEGFPEPELHVALRNAVAEATVQGVEGTKVRDGFGDHVFTLRAEDKVQK